MTPLPSSDKVDSPTTNSRGYPTQPTFFQKVIFSLVEWAFLKQITRGRLEVTFPDDSVKTYGEAAPQNSGSDDVGTGRCHVYSWQVWVRLALEDDIGFSEAYMAGMWDSEDLTTMLCLICEQMKAGALIGFPLVKSIDLTLRGIYRYFFRNTASQSLLNVEEHYDIGNELYERMLDPSTFSYTCALFRDPSKPHFAGEGQFEGAGKFPPDNSEAGKSPNRKKISLCQAQINKIELLIRKGNIQKHHRVLELGCGFGGFSRHLAKTVGCEIDAYNLSVEQLKYAREQAEKDGVGHLINYVHDDYRACVNYEKTELKDSKTSYTKAYSHKHKPHSKVPSDSRDHSPLQYDVIVSIGMLEHVGHHDLHQGFFKTAGRSLKPGGLLLVHTITASETGYDVQRHHQGFIQKYIFPGACIPAVGAILDAALWGGVEGSVWGAARSGTREIRQKREGNQCFELQHFENIGENYAPTLRGWRENFYKNVEEIKKLKDEKTGKAKYDSAFLRMWELYLCNCEAEFLTGHMSRIIFSSMAYLQPNASPAPRKRQTINLKWADFRAKTLIWPKSQKQLVPKQ